MKPVRIALRALLWTAAALPCGGCASPSKPGAGDDSGTGGSSSGGSSNRGGDSSGIDGGTSGTIAGSVDGQSFSTVGSSWWIGMPAAGSPPVMIFVSDAPLNCTTLSNAGWDKAIGDHQLLEMAAPSTVPGDYRIGTDADANYVRGAYNPTADGVTVTIGVVKPSESITGAFDLTFGADALRGTFEAKWCAGGVEP